MCFSSLLDIYQVNQHNMNVYAEKDYRKIIAALLEERRIDNADVNYQGLAQAMRIPKSYLSKIMHGRADLSFDQLFLAAQYFRLTFEEREYLDLLLSYARCGLADRKSALEEKIEKIRHRHFDTRAHLAADIIDNAVGLHEYYLDPVYQLVHAALSLEKYTTSLKSLAEDLGIALSRILDAAMGLERLGIIERSDGNIQILRPAMHLPKESPFYEGWRAQLRLLGLQRTQAIAKESHYAFSVVFSAGLKTDQEIKMKFFEFLKSIESEVGSAPCERVYQMNFDILPWT